MWLEACFEELGELCMVEIPIDNWNAKILKLALRSPTYIVSNILKSIIKIN